MRLYPYLKFRVNGEKDGGKKAIKYENLKSHRKTKINHFAFFTDTYVIIINKTKIQM